MDPDLVLARVARDSYGRLIAQLVKRWGDLGLAEDALSEAMTLAVSRWPSGGVPNSPEGWLLAVAHRRCIDQVRRKSRGRELEREALQPWAQEGEELSSIPDERLELMMLCCHPALTQEIRVPLMLNAVWGISARRLANGFALKPSAMSARLLRAKQKIKETRLRFPKPSPDEFEERIGSLRQAFYLAFNIAAETDQPEFSLRTEISSLVELLRKLQPAPDPETLGLLALFKFQSARDPSRRRSDGTMISFLEQDIELWDLSLIREAERLLTQAHRGGILGRFQLEAAIESAHIKGRYRGETDWPAILTLYQGLLTTTSNLGPRVAFAGALLEAGELLQAEEVLQSLQPESVAHYQPYWATQAALLKTLGRQKESQEALARAKALSQSPAQKAFLEELS